jgi:hypothetical protein
VDNSATAKKQARLSGAIRRTATVKGFDVLWKLLSLSKFTDTPYKQPVDK